MNNSILFGLMVIGLIVLIISLEWDRIKKIDFKKLVIVLIILFFLLSGMVYLFTQ